MTNAHTFSGVWFSLLSSLLTLSLSLSVGRRVGCRTERGRRVRTKRRWTFVTLERQEGESICLSSFSLFWVRLKAWCSCGAYLSFFPETRCDVSFSPRRPRLITVTLRGDTSD